MTSNNEDTNEPELQPGMLWRSKNAYMRVSSLSVASKDGFDVDESDIDRFGFHNVQTADNPYVSFHLSDANEEIRMFFMRPHLDGHLPQDNPNTIDDTYGWKLYSTWISSVEADSGYYYWNENNQADSQLVIPKDGYDGFTCDLVEFDLQPRHKASPADSVAFVNPPTKVKMNDFEIGIFPPGIDRPDRQDMKLYNPCELKTCRALNGTVYCGALRPWVVFTGLLVLVVLGLCIACACMVCCTRTVAARYNRLTMDEAEAFENDLELDETGGNGVDDTDVGYQDDFQDEPTNSGNTSNGIRDNNDDDGDDDDGGIEKNKYPNWSC